MQFYEKLHNDIYKIAQRRVSERWWLPPLAAAFCDIEQLRKSLLVTAWRDNSGETASLQDSGEIVTVLYYLPHIIAQSNNKHSCYSRFFLNPSDENTKNDDEKLIAHA